MSMYSRVRHIFRRISLVPKMLFLTMGVGIMLTAIVDSVQTSRLDRFFGSDLNQRLARHAEEERVQFDSHVAAYHRNIKLIVSQKRFIDYVSKMRFGNSDRVTHYTVPLPPWLPDASVMRQFVPIQFALLLDEHGRVREVYQGASDPFPPSLLQPVNLLIQLSHNQSYMTSVDGRPFLLTAESYSGPDGRPAATLLLAQELNDDFLIATHGPVYTEYVDALVAREPTRIVASSRPDLIPDGAPFDELKDAYLIAGKSFFDWGASDLVLEFTTFISKTEFAKLNESVLKSQRQERIIIAVVLVLSFSLLMLWMAERIQKLTRSIDDYAQRRLGTSLRATAKGDQLSALEEQFHIFTDEIEASREQLKRQAEDLLREKTVYLDNILQSSPVSIIAADLELRIKYYNAAAEKVFGYDPLYAVGKKTAALSAEGSPIHSIFKNALATIGSGGAYADTAVMHGTGTTTYFDVTVHGISDKQNILTGYLLLAHDITERLRTEKDLLLFRNMVDASNDAFFVIDPQTGHLLDVNERACLRLGYERDELLALRIQDINPIVPDEASWKNTVETVRRKHAFVWESMHRKKSGENFSVEISARLISLEGRDYLIGVARDITQRKKIETELRIKDSAIAASINGIAISDMQGIIQYVNRSYVTMMGYADESELLGRPMSDFAESAEQVDMVRGALRTRGGWVGELTGRKKDGSVIPRLMSASLVTDDAGRPISVLGSFVDITERKKAEAALRSSQETLQKIIDGSSAVIFAKDLEGKYLFINSLYERLFHVSKIEAVGKTDYDLFPSEAAKAFREADLKALQAGTTIEAEEQVPQDDGVHYYISLKFPLYDNDGNPIAVCGLATDITERKKGETRIATSLQEKEILLREIHHRVKNNLQIISSLLYFQAKKVRDEAGLAALREGQERLKSMILVHEKLYQSKDLARIDFADYVRTLTDQMLPSYAAVRSKIKVTVEAGALFLPIEIALPCGMIINELLTNVFKYAFPGELMGTALVRVTSEPERMSIVVRDSGVGLPPDMDAERPDTFGLQLVRNLARQLCGAVSFERNGGTTVTINIPLGGAASPLTVNGPSEGAVQ